MKTTSDIKSIHWDITKKCNLRCSHCYNADKYFNKNSEEYIDNELSLEECLKTVDKLYEAGFGHIHFLGGEPLFSENIFPVIKKAKKYGMLISINSNAILLTEEVQNKLIELDIDQYAASIDGCTAKVNDSIRGAGTFDLICKNMKNFNALIKKSKSKIETLIVFTLTKANSEEILLLPKLANDLGVGLITLTTFIESGNGNINKDNFSCDIGYLCDKIENMVKEELINYDVALQLDMRPLFCEYLVAKYNANVIFNLKNSLCSAGEKVWYLEADGKVHPCLVFQLESGKEALKRSEFIKEDICISNIKINDVKESVYWKSFLKKKKQYDVNNVPTCKNCLLSDICSPCFLDYDKYDKKVLECEHVKSKSLSEYNIKKDWIISLDENVNYKNGVVYKNNKEILTFNDNLTKEMLDIINETKKVSELFDLIYNEYEIDKEWLMYEINTFLNKLISNQVIVKRERDNMKYIKNKSLVIENIDEQSIIFDKENNQFYELDEIGSIILDKIEEKSIDNIKEEIMERYAVDSLILENDISGLLEDLLKKKIIIEIN
ncbi:PqqD family peptide modification chaperone (plasmid) [Clostridium perfringens]|uniref:PqqD family peptide modification chaperone n=1 Tax=Clostridium perfringens TaxID=1502 RepID=UPI0030CFFDD4